MEVEIVSQNEKTGFYPVFSIDIIYVDEATDLN